jgi:hypothetical protein
LAPDAHQPVAFSNLIQLFVCHCFWLNAKSVQQTLPIRPASSRQALTGIGDLRNPATSLGEARPHLGLALGCGTNRAAAKTGGDINIAVDDGIVEGVRRLAR